MGIVNDTVGHLGHSPDFETKARRPKAPLDPAEHASLVTYSLQSWLLMARSLSTTELRESLRVRASHERDLVVKGALLGIRGAFLPGETEDPYHQRNGEDR